MDAGTMYANAKALHELLQEERAENAKLRELVRTIYMCSNIRCRECEYGQGNSCTFDAEEALRELGVEP